MTRQVLSPAKIIQTSIELIEAGEQLSFSTIARALGTKSQALYSYFDNQTALGYAVVGWTIAQVNDRLRTQLFGLSGQQGIVAFATEFRKLALAHPRLTRFVLARPRTKDYAVATAAFTQLRQLLNQMIASQYPESQRLLVSRCVRALMVGDIVNVGTGWFTDETISAADSFHELLMMNLEMLATK
ncbi:hypothetical protein BSQ39_05400 [Loigolactobacillus backii]|uniref:TetR/AcrR family transcriptional regulator n=1 Tax=Loigolactobacillus backii TaxID=375175 RepID=UPI000C1CA1B7|nr:TetR/AcrR family transcriptional regulator [Loigolactobacillus backii]PIO83048.1 hypothetical protein BSQ39_05400 [Loigolactobacillus backii]